jgi:hypothetical protein
MTSTYEEISPAGSLIWHRIDTGCRAAGGTVKWSTPGWAPAFRDKFLLVKEALAEMSDDGEGDLLLFRVGFRS